MSWHPSQSSKKKRKWKAFDGIFRVTGHQSEGLEDKSDFRLPGGFAFMGEYLVLEDEAWILCENFVTWKIPKIGVPPNHPF